MTKGRFTTVCLSIGLHGLVFILLASIKITLPKKIPTRPKAINSFIYHAPKVIIDTVQKKTHEITIEKTFPIAKKVQPTKVNEAILGKRSYTYRKKTSKSAADIVVSQINKSAVSSSKINTALSINKQKNSTFSALNQLNNLQTSITQTIINQNLEQQQRHRSVSSMHVQPLSVPHSKKQISLEEKHKAATTQLSGSLSITKGDDGVCTITQDLSNVGMEGASSTQAFSCGKSKFDKNFRQHMDKVREKLGK